ncbi:putative acyl-activating enzyme 19 isoform X9 [Malus sylvestris]|uniref:putative acyl-activating enzyme 19 isoform X6 n=1 Tax=Malus domestica TaxID=3750 RepID=UPI0021AC5A86|nr:putative acyl-activating enzyme 19 isoform X9 [Malus sylvestris]
MPRNDAPQATRSNTHCCLSREFSAAASTNTDKIAVIHASGGALLSLQPRPRFSISDDAAPAPVRQQLLYDGDHSFTYSRLFSAVNSLTSQLLSAPQLPSSYKKLGPRIFGIYMPPSAEYIVSVLSVLRCGEAFLPLDPSWPKQRLLSVISSADVDLIVACKTPFGFESDSNWLPETCKRSVLWFSMEEVGECRNGVIDWACKCESGGKERLWCYLMYTSGSTGKPKGVCGTEGGLLNRFRWMQELYPLFGDEVLLFKTGISFVDHLQEFLSSILTGCTLVIPPFDHLKRNVFSILDFLQAYSVSRLTAVPSLMRTILPSLQGRKEERLPTSLDLLVLSGEVLPLSLWEMLSKILPRTSILNLYGSTEAFSDVLRADEVSDDDDFFMMGGDSIAAAHLSNNIGVDMRLIYSFPTPSKLCTALLERKGSFNMNVSRDSKSKMNLGGDKQSIYHVQSETPNAVNVDGQRRFLRTLSERNEDDTIISKRLKVDSNVASGATGPSDGYPWNSGAIHVSCSFSRCNKVVYEGGSRVKDMYQATCSVLVPRKKFNMQESWKVYVGSCVDASPLIVHKDQDIYLFIGSHSQKFLCVNARSGSVQWEVQLEGRVECSAATLDDFTQVVVGCYRGKIYFLDSLTGNICWTFQTSGEVKSQPVIDSRRQLIWCGSYDHNLYALDYKNHCCVYQLPCGGSIYGSPVIDETNNILYVASTSGRMTAISIMALPFSSMWRHELEAPVFGSLAINSLNGNIICGLVDGQVLALDTSGSVIWRYRTAGPIFAGACISSDLPLQVLVCSRDGSIYSLKLETGDLLWEYNVKDPITSSAYVDEHLSLASDPPNLPDRLVCVCSSSGSVYLLRVNSGAAKVANQRMDVEEFARLDLGGDVFSSPVMIGGRIFVGCRDDYVHCITVKP